MKHKMGAIFYQFSLFYEHRFVIYDQSINKSDTELKSYCIPLGLCRIGWSSYYLCTSTLHFTNIYKRLQIKCSRLEIIYYEVDAEDFPKLKFNIGLLHSNILSKIHYFEMSSISIPYFLLLFSLFYMHFHPSQLFESTIICKWLS